MRKQLVEVNYPEHGEGVTLPRVVLVLEQYPQYFNGIDMVKFHETGSVKESVRAFRYSKVPHRGMTTISFPNLNKTKDLPYPRDEVVNKILNSLKKGHKSPAH